jgi:site-specific recombinase XerD
LGISTGGRIAELLSLKIEDVWQGGQAVSDLLYEKNVVKGKENSRLIPVNSDARQAINELIEWHKEQYGSTGSRQIDVILHPKKLVSLFA